ncbi:MAG: TRM11 family SAM-dependent methyltransferase, partial [Candidatus Bathyarchaeia archaeon]
YGLEPEAVAVADARHLPIADSSVDCVVTDPPYGISATTLGSRLAELIEAFLLNVIDKIKSGRMICLAAPRSIGIGGLGERLGFKHIESHFVYVHRSLTREIAVLMRG